MKTKVIGVRAPTALAKRLEKIEKETGVSKSALANAIWEVAADFYDSNGYITLPFTITPKNEPEPEQPEPRPRRKIKVGDVTLED